MKSSLCNILLVLVSLVLCIVFGEAALRIIYHHISSYDYEMWRYAADMKQSLPSKDLPFHHYPNRSGVYYGIEISTNSLGLRDKEYRITKAAGTKRILFLGDSHTMGWGVSLERTLSKLIEKRLSAEGYHADVINMGAGNYNTAMEVELFKTKGLQLDPDLVVLMYFINDTEPTPVLHPFKDALIRHSYLLGSVLRMIRQIPLMRGNEDGLTEYYRPLYSGNSAGLSLTTKSLKELVQICRQNSIGLLVVNIPELRRLKRYPFSFATEYIRRTSDEAGVAFLDLLPIFENQEDQSLWVSPEDPHMNAKAHSLAAEAVLDRLMSTGLGEKSLRRYGR